MKSLWNIDSKEVQDILDIDPSYFIMHYECCSNCIHCDRSTQTLDALNEKHRNEDNSYDDNYVLCTKYNEEPYWDCKCVSYEKIHLNDKNPFMISFE